MQEAPSKSTAVSKCFLSEKALIVVRIYLQKLNRYTTNRTLLHPSEGKDPTGHACLSPRKVTAQLSAHFDLS